MTNQRSGSLHFYQAQYFATHLSNSTSTLFRSGRLILATKQCDHAVLLMTDNQGASLHAQTSSIGKSMAYPPFGHESLVRTYSIPAYNGEWPDSFTGHYLLGNGYRAFSTTLRRFLSPDGHSPFAAGGVNSYAYCLNDPFNNTDPTGRMPVHTPPIVKGTTYGLALINDKTLFHNSQSFPPSYQYTKPVISSNFSFDPPDYSILPGTWQATITHSLDKYGAHNPGTFLKIKSETFALYDDYNKLMIQMADILSKGLQESPRHRIQLSEMARSRSDIRMRIIANYHRPLLPPPYDPEWQKNLMKRPATTSLEKF